MTDLRSHGYCSDPLMLFENFSANMDAVRNTICYIHRCEGFAELVLEIQGIELAHRYAKIFRAYCDAVVGQRQLLLEYGLTQESQFLLHSELSAHLSTTISFETVYKVLLVGDCIQRLSANGKFGCGAEHDLLYPPLRRLRGARAQDTRNRARASLREDISSIL